MRKGQMFQELGEECSRERAEQEKGCRGSASGVCWRRRRLARSMWEVRRNRWEGSHIPQDLTAVFRFPRWMESHWGVLSRESWQDLVYFLNGHSARWRIDDVGARESSTALQDILTPSSEFPGTSLLTDFAFKYMQSCTILLQLCSNNLTECSLLDFIPWLLS